VDTNASETIQQYHVGIIGGGPAGTGPLFSALQDGKLRELLDSGVALFESGENLAKGRLGEFDLNSDTLSNAFLEILDKDPESLLTGIESSDATREILAYRGRSVPLPIVGDYLRCLGQRLREIIANHSDSRVFLNTRVTAAHRLGDGTFIVEVKTSAGQQAEVFCRNVVIATGGAQSVDDAKSEEILGRKWLSEPRFANKLLLTGDILQGRADLKRLAASSNPRVVILGASHSAFSAAWYLLNHQNANFAENGIHILHRGRPKLFFGSEAEAHEAGYNDFDDFDICPLTKRVYRLAGLRFDGRGLLMQLLGVGDAKPEPRVALRSLEQIDSDLESLLEEADIIVPAFGYRPQAIPLFENGEPISLLADHGGPLVDNQCRVLDATANPIAGAFGIGLASGFIPSGNLEASQASAVKPMASGSIKMAWGKSLPTRCWASVKSVQNFRPSELRHEDPRL